MPPDWRRELLADDLHIDDDTHITVSFPSGRTQRVRCEEQPDAWRLTSTCARRRHVIDDEGLAERIWEQNAHTPLVGLRIDSRDRLVGAVVLPKAGLTADEMGAAIRMLARECDRVEFVVTGRDVE